jgi:hypothetical protein
MRLIIAGSRDIVDYQILVIAMEKYKLSPDVIISGTARGTDKLGERWAKEHNIPVEKYPADWDTYGKSAGYRRNAEMANAADALLALWDGKSKGTKHMIDLAKKKSLKIFIYE